MSMKNEISLFDDKVSVALLRQCPLLSAKGNVSYFESLLCYARDRIFHSGNLDIDPKFIYKYDTFVYKLGLWLAFTLSE